MESAIRLTMENRPMYGEAVSKVMQGKRVKNVTEKRYRWDILQFSKFKTHEGKEIGGIQFIYFNIFPYATDRDIDEVLCKITGTN